MTIRKESGSWKWAVLSIVTTITIAWLASFAAYKIGVLLWL